MKVSFNQSLAQMLSELPNTKTFLLKFRTYEKVTKRSAFPSSVPNETRHLIWQLMPQKLTLFFQKWSWLVLFFVTYFSTQQGISRPLLKSGKSREFSCVLLIREFPFNFRD